MNNKEQARLYGFYISPDGFAAFLAITSLFTLSAIWITMERHQLSVSCELSSQEVTVRLGLLLIK